MGSGAAPVPRPRLRDSAFLPGAVRDGVRPGLSHRRGPAARPGASLLEKGSDEATLPRSPPLSRRVPLFPGCLGAGGASYPVCGRDKRENGAFRKELLTGEGAHMNSP